MLKFRDVLSRWERRALSMMDAAEVLGMSERQFRRVARTRHRTPHLARRPALTAARHEAKGKLRSGRKTGFQVEQRNWTSSHNSTPLNQQTAPGGVPGL